MQGFFFLNSIFKEEKIVGFIDKNEFSIDSEMCFKEAQLLQNRQKTDK